MCAYTLNATNIYIYLYETTDLLVIMVNNYGVLPFLIEHDLI